jgi:hypothetical protein
MNILVTLYFIFGLFCSYHWFEEDYGKEYRELKEKKESEDGMAVILLILMAIFWLPIFLYKVYKAL